MRFLITDLGHEDLILGYPWLAMFEPKFSWADGTIDMDNLPVIVKSLNWETRLTKTTISRTMAEPVSTQEKMQIVEELEEECFTISTRLVQEAHQYQQEVKIPEEYQQCHDSDVGMDYFSFVIFPSHHCSLFASSPCTESRLLPVYSHVLTHLV